MFPPNVIFALILLVIAIILLLHHYWHHSHDNEDSKAKQDSCDAVCYFQLSDIRNHETWIIVCFTNALSLWVIAPSLIN